MILSIWFKNKVELQTLSSPSSTTQSQSAATFNFNRKSRLTTICWMILTTSTRSRRLQISRWYLAHSAMSTTASLQESHSSNPTIWSPQVNSWQLWRQQAPKKPTPKTSKRQRRHSRILHRSQKAWRLAPSHFTIAIIRAKHQPQVLESQASKPIYSKKTIIGRINNTRRSYATLLLSAKIQMRSMMVFSEAEKDQHRWQISNVYWLMTRGLSNWFSW